MDRKPAFSKYESPSRVVLLNGKTAGSKRVIKMTTFPALKPGQLRIVTSWGDLAEASAERPSDLDVYLDFALPSGSPGTRPDICQVSNVNGRTSCGNSTVELDSKELRVKSIRVDTVYATTYRFFVASQGGYDIETRRKKESRTYTI